MVTAAGRPSVNLEHTNLNRVSQGQGGAAPGATALTQLGRMAVRLLSADTTEVRRNSSVVQHAVTQSNKQGVLLGKVVSSPGPEALLIPPKQDRPFHRTDVLVEVSNGLAGASDVGRSLLSGASLTHVNPQDAALPVMGTNIGIAGVGMLAGGLAIRHAFKKVRALEAELNKILAKSERTTDESARAERLKEQIQAARFGRNMTTGIVGTSLGLGVAAGVSGGLGSAVVATSVGTVLSGMTVGLSVMGAMADARQIKVQQAANEKLTAGFEGLQNTTSKNLSDKDALLNSLESVGKHAKTAGKSRLKGKWTSLAYNVLTGLSGVAALTTKILMLAGAGAGAVAAASSVLLVSGGAVLVAGLAFAAYKYVRYRQDKSQAAQDLIQNPAAQSPEMEKHQKLMATNKYYAVKQLALDIQNGTDDRFRTRAYFETALGLTGDQANKLIDLLISQPGHEEGIQMLSNALFRSRAVNL